MILKINVFYFKINLCHKIHSLISVLLFSTTQQITTLQAHFVQLNRWQFEGLEASGSGKIKFNSGILKNGGFWKIYSLWTNIFWTVQTLNLSILGTELNRALLAAERIRTAWRFRNGSRWLALGLRCVRVSNHKTAQFTTHVANKQRSIIFRNRNRTYGRFIA